MQLIYKTGRVLLQTTPPTPEVIPLCDQRPILTGSQRAMGTLFSWFACFLYIGSRIPQIHKNYTRKTLQGFSLYMVSLAVFANLTDALAVFMRDPELDMKFYRGTLPYIISALGTMMLDVLMLVQFWYYDHRNPQEKVKYTLVPHEE